MDQAEKIRIAGVKPMNVSPPLGAVPMAVADLQNDDEKYWMQLTDTVWSRPLVINAHNGGWIECFRLSGPGLINRHRHSTPAFVYCLEGTCGYLEHDWVLDPGGVLYEPVGETHTSEPALIFYRSPQVQRSWLTAATKCRSTSWCTGRRSRRLRSRASGATIR